MRLALALIVSALPLAQGMRRPTPQAPTAATRWGQITGQLPNQQDLQAALDAKQGKLPTGTAADYLRGDLTIAPFPVSTGAATWGNVGGDIKQQSDLQGELNGRMPLSTVTKLQSEKVDATTPTDFKVETLRRPQWH